MPMFLEASLLKSSGEFSHEEIKKKDKRKAAFRKKNLWNLESFITKVFHEDKDIIKNTTLTDISA